MCFSGRSASLGSACSRFACAKVICFYVSAKYCGNFLLGYCINCSETPSYVSFCGSKGRVSGCGFGKTEVRWGSRCRFMVGAGWLLLFSKTARGVLRPRWVSLLSEVPTKAEGFFLHFCCTMMSEPAGSDM